MTIRLQKVNETYKDVVLPYFWWISVSILKLICVPYVEKLEQSIYMGLAFKSWRNYDNMQMYWEIYIKCHQGSANVVYSCLKILFQSIKIYTVFLKNSDEKCFFIFL